MKIKMCIIQIIFLKEFNLRTHRIHRKFLRAEDIKYYLKQVDLYNIMSHEMTRFRKQ